MVVGLGAKGCAAGDKSEAFADTFAESKGAPSYASVTSPDDSDTLVDESVVAPDVSLSRRAIAVPYEPTITFPSASSADTLTAVLVGRPASG